MYENSEGLGEQHADPSETLEFFAYAGNDERKLLLILALSQVGQPLTGMGMYRLLCDFSNEDLPGSRGTVRGFAEKSLLKIGVVETDTVEVEYEPISPNSHGFVKPAKGFSLTDKGRAFVSPAAELLKWSLYTPNISLRSIGGGTNTKSAQPAPITRYQYLKSHQAKEFAIPTGGEALSSSTKTSMVERLADQGVLTKENGLVEPKTAVNDLLSIIDDFQAANEVRIADGSHFSRVVLSTPEIFRHLYIKAFEASNHSIHDEFIDQRIKRIVEELGSDATKKLIRDTYSLETGRNVSLPVVEKSLGRLMALGQIYVEKRFKAKKHPPNRNRYSSA